MVDDSRKFHRRGGNEVGIASWVSSGNQWKTLSLNYHGGGGVTGADICSIGHHEGCSWGTNSLKVFFALPSTLAGDIKERLHFCHEDTEGLFCHTVALGETAASSPR